MRAIRCAASARRNTRQPLERTKEGEGHLCHRTPRRPRLAKHIPQPRDARPRRSRRPRRALPAAGLAIVPSFVRRRPRAIDLGPIDAFPEGEFTAVTFLTDPAAGEISRRAAYVRNNGLLGTEPSFTIMSSRCTHVGCPTQPNGPLFRDEGRADRRRERSCRRGRPASAVPATAASSTRRETEPPARTARARPVRVLDPQRPALPRPPLQRRPRRRRRRRGADPRVRAPGRRATGQRARVVALPARPAS